MHEVLGISAEVARFAPAASRGGERGSGLRLVAWARLRPLSGPSWRSARGCGRPAADSRYAQEHERDATVPLAQQRFRAHLRLRIGPGRLYGRVFADPRVRPVRRLMDEHRARINELLDLEGLQLVDQPNGSYAVSCLPS